MSRHTPHSSSAPGSTSVSTNARAPRTRRRYAVSLLVDGSASMLSPGRRANAGQHQWAMPAAMLGAWSMARLCDELQIDFEVALFNRGFAATRRRHRGELRQGGSAASAGLRRTQGSAADRLTSTVNHYLVKPFDRRWRDAQAHPRRLCSSPRSTPRQAATLARRDARSAPPGVPVREGGQRRRVQRHSCRRADGTARLRRPTADGACRRDDPGVGRSAHQVGRGRRGNGDDGHRHRHRRPHRRPDVPTSRGRRRSPNSSRRQWSKAPSGALRRSLAFSGMDTWWLRASDFREKEISVA